MAINSLNHPFVCRTAQVSLHCPVPYTTLPTVCKYEVVVQKLNPLPFVFISANCVAWVSYSFVTDNWYLFVPNTLGFLIGLFLFLVTFGIGIPSTLERDKLTAAAIVLAAILPVLAAVERLVLESHEAQKQLWGYAGAGHLLLLHRDCI
jgi:hypothetical protein